MSPDTRGPVWASVKAASASVVAVAKQLARGAVKGGSQGDRGGVAAVVAGAAWELGLEAPWLIGRLVCPRLVYRIGQSDKATKWWSRKFAQR